MSALRLYNTLGELGLIAGSSGNVSTRTSRGMLITPSGGAPGGVGQAGMAKVTLDGTSLNKATPSSEWEMHAAIYRAFPAAGCVVHTHADACTALACLNEELPPFHYMVVQFGGANVRCAPYVTFGTPELAREAVTALQGRSVCLLANHGMIVYAHDADRALSRAVLLESLCRQYLLARSAGTPRLLSDREIAAAVERFKSYGPRTERIKS
ncbi:MAG: class II aldolase [Acetobacteraceae bacterium]|nr:class II aldolase [Acetobacteraceae bacterium]